MESAASTIPLKDATTLAVGSPTPSAWELAHVAIDRAVRDNQKTVLILNFTAPVGDPLAWLSNHLGVPSVYWRSRDGWEYAGLGAVHVLGGRGPGAMGRIANEAALFLQERVVSEMVPSARRPRFFGGFAFDPLHTGSEEWHQGGFGDAALILPEALYVRRDSQSHFFFAFEVTTRSTPDDTLNRLALLNQLYWGRFTAADAPGTDEVWSESATDDVMHRNWLSKSQIIIDQIEARMVDKVVLAQRSELRAAEKKDSTLNPWPTVARLREFDSTCFHFGFQLTDRYAFVGASPERLFRLAGTQLDCEAIAGTIARGVSELDDRELATQLLASAKDRLELRYVVQAIERALDRLAASETSSRPSEPDVVRLRTLQHLRTVISAKVPNGTTVGAILNALHPTPAVAGVPLDRACALIREHEPDGRGWYGGPMGWIGTDAAEFAVGIRSALLNSEMAWVYAGAGLVRGSIPESEWQETRDKLQVFRRASNSRAHTQ